MNRENSGHIIRVEEERMEFVLDFIGSVYYWEDICVACVRMHIRVTRVHY